MCAHFMRLWYTVGPLVYSVAGHCLFSKTVYEREKRNHESPFSLVSLGIMKEHIRYNIQCIGLSSHVYMVNAQNKATRSLGQVSKVGLILLAVQAAHCLPSHDHHIP